MSLSEQQIAARDALLQTRLEKTAFSQGAIVVVTGIPPDCSNAELFSAFSRLGALQARVVKEHRLGGVMFSPEVRISAVLNSVQGLAIRGFPVTVFECSDQDRVFFKRLPRPPVHPVPSEGDKICVIDFEAAIMIKGGFSVPLEVALVQVQLTSDIQQQHVVNQYHGFIDPGAIPEWHLAQVAFVESNIHGIPLPTDNDASATNISWTRDYKGVSLALTEIFRDSRFIVAKGKLTEERCLEWIADRAEEDSQSWVPPVVEYSQFLKAICGKGAAETEETDTHSYTCYYHDCIDPSYHCALADVHRYINTIISLWRKRE